MKKLMVFLGLVWSGSQAFGQEANNNLWASFESTSSDQTFQKFAFDNNGKVWIDDFGKGDFFIKGDTLFVFPDKDIFKFLVKEDQLVGVSNWVQDGVWVRSGDLVDNNRLNDQEARIQAQLYDEYYTKTRVGISQFDFLFDADLYEQYLIDLESLCDRKMVKACTELFGNYSVDISKLDLRDLEELKESDPKNPLRIAKKVAAFDPELGEYLMSLYEEMIGRN